MATSDSDDFESADEELVARDTPSRKLSNQWQSPNSAIDSESDDDNECMPSVNSSGSRSVQTSGQERVRSRSSVASIESIQGGTPSAKAETNKPKGTPKASSCVDEPEGKKNTSDQPASSKDCSDSDLIAKKLTDLSVANVGQVNPKASPSIDDSEGKKNTSDRPVSSKDRSVGNLMGKKLTDLSQGAANVEQVNPKDKCIAGAKIDDAARKLSFLTDETAECSAMKEESIDKSEATTARRERVPRQRRPKESKGLGAKKLGSKVATEAPPRPPPVDAETPEEIKQRAIAEGKEPPIIEECWEFNEEETAKILQGMKDFGLGEGDRVRMPEELKSEKKFSEVFKPEGWEGLNDEEILAELDENGVRPVLDKMASATEDRSNYTGWGSWGSWGMNSLINSATASVTTLAGHVTHGLTLLDEAVGAPNPAELARPELQPDDDDASIEDKSSGSQEIQSSFGFNDLISGVSSITKLVESTGTKVITGGLGTLETIGKKTMEVLQEGDPGLKKKRAFFMNEGDKPILSQMLREAKEKAEVEEKTLEEKQLSRKVHFESLFDDYQGLVHLEALEMLSKQCNIKIQQRLVTLDADDLTSIQETLEEVKELCDLGDEDEEEEDNENNLQERLQAASKDLGVAITYEKLHDIWKDTRTYLAEVSSADSIVSEREVFQRAISTLARFTAFSVERFHKTAELLLIKERRSTVNEADALVQLTRILSAQIGIAANSFSNWLNDRIKNTEKPNSKVDITTIFLEAANASSYIQDAFRLLIPILQVGAI